MPICAILSKTRNSAIADKPVKVTKHGTIPYVTYVFLLVSYSNLVPNDLENRVKGL